jgi:hypothetical protein
MKLPGRPHTLAIAAVAVIGLLALSGCQATGGGSIPSAPSIGAKKATFAFNLTGVRTGPFSAEPVRLKGAWSDGYVKFQVDDLVFIDGDSGGGICNGDWMYGVGRYVSSNKAHRGSGEVDLTMCDAGQPGASSGDDISIVLYDGPFDGYQNAGPLTNGNLQVKLDE